MKAHLHFTFGPVQSFVAQARRTRDLYAGSFLLSHLAMAAMRGAKEAGGKIILPDFDSLDGLNPKPEHAIAPNRFVAEFDSLENAKAAGTKATSAFMTAWENIANAVWNDRLEQHAKAGNNTTKIWSRQVKNFWNVAWVVGEENESNLLDRRKNWQTHWPDPEGGDHCVLMGQWQELSGFIRSNERKAQDAFWDAVRNGVSNLDLESGERLCAIAFIKRFFPSVSENAIDQKLDPKGWPSTVTIAALPWMRKIGADPELHAEAKSYAAMLTNEPGAIMASAQRIKLLKDFPPCAGEFAKLSGNFLNHTALANADDTPLNQESDRGVFLKSLGKLEEATGDRAGNFYAVLLMDGDSMGKLIHEHGPVKITNALTQFASKAPNIIQDHDGVTVYAGGDDLLALLPLDTALTAASAVHQLYCESFEPTTNATVSAAIVFAHYHCTFSRVLASAHELLDDVAKDRTGRDALAIRVLKPGGLTCEWSAPFDHFKKSDKSSPPDAPHLFQPLIEQFGERKLPSSSLLYNLRERFSQLTHGDSAQVDRKQLLKLFTAEALIGKAKAEDDEAMKTLMNQLLNVCEEVKREPCGGIVHTGRFTFEGPRLLKFLALDGKEGAL